MEKTTKNKINSTPFSMRLDIKDKKVFQSKYPYCLSRFVKLCVFRAVSDPSFFNEVYFNTKKEL